LKNISDSSTLKVLRNFPLFLSCKAILNLLTELENRSSSLFLNLISFKKAFCMSERYTERMQEIWSRCQEEARPYSPELFLYCLIKNTEKSIRSVSEGLALSILKNLQAPLDKIQKRLQEHLQEFSSPFPLEENHSFSTPSMKKFLLLLSEETQETQGKITSFHLLQALLKMETFASHLLQEQGISLAKIHCEKEKILQLLQGNWSFSEEDHIEEGYPLWFSKKISFFSYLQFPIQFFFFFMWPLFWTIGCLTFGQYSLIAMIWIVLIFSTFFSFGKKFRLTFSWFDKTPLLSLFLHPFRDFYNYYFQYPPRPFFLYLFYPVLFPFFLLFSPSSRQEFFIFMKIVILIMVVLLLETLVFYPSLYPPYLQFSDALSILGYQFLAFGIIMIFSVMPTISTSFSFSFSGRKISLVLFTFMALGFSLLGIFTFTQILSLQNYPKAISSNLLQKRIYKKNFQEDLKSFSCQILNPARLQSFDPCSVEGVSPQESATEFLQDQVKKLVPSDEEKAFHFFSVSFKNKQGTLETWGGIGMNISENSYFRPLILVSPQNQSYYSWKALPEELQKQFVIISEPLPSENKIRSWNELRYAGLLEEFQSIWDLGN
jgi:hypothetical protein